MSNIDRVKWVFGCGMIGVILSMITYEMNTRGLLIDEYITGTILITDVMAVIIIMFLLIGVLIAMLK